VSNEILKLLIKVYGQLKDVQNARKAFYALIEDSNSYSLNRHIFHTFLEILAEAGELQEALNVFEMMKSRGIKISFITCNHLLLAYGTAGEWLQCLTKFAEWKREGLVKPSTYVVMMRVAGMNGQLNMAFEFLDRLLNVFINYRVLDGCKAFVVMIEACYANNAPHRVWDVIQRFLTVQNRNPTWKTIIDPRFIYCFASRVLEGSASIEALPENLKQLRQRFIDNYEPQKKKNPTAQDKELFVQFVNDCFTLFSKQKNPIKKESA
jgi:pentatricopeptide repeat protein